MYINKDIFDGLLYFFKLLKNVSKFKINQMFYNYYIRIQGRYFWIVLYSISLYNRSYIIKALEKKLWNISCRIKALE